MYELNYTCAHVNKPTVHMPSQSSVSLRSVLISI